MIETENRDEVRQKLGAAGIDTGLHYPVPVHLQKAYTSLGYKPGDFPVSERIAQQCISLPMFAKLTDEQVSYVASTLRAA